MNVAFSLYMQYTGVTSAYGPAGSLVALVRLAYFSALALLFGAELTQAIAGRDGRPAGKRTPDADDDRSDPDEARDGA